MLKGETITNRPPCWSSHFPLNPTTNLGILLRRFRKVGSNVNPRLKRTRPQNRQQDDSENQDDQQQSSVPHNNTESYRGIKSIPKRRKTGLVHGEHEMMTWIRTRQHAIETSHWMGSELCPSGAARGEHTQPVGLRQQHLVVENQKKNEHRRMAFHLLRSDLGGTPHHEVSASRRVWIWCPLDSLGTTRGFARRNEKHGD